MQHCPTAPPEHSWWSRQTARGALGGHESVELGVCVGAYVFQRSVIDVVPPHSICLSGIHRQSVATAKGSILVGNGTATISRTVGTNNTSLIVIVITTPCCAIREHREAICRSSSNTRSNQSNQIS
jgi:uncharacterized protein YndB with AHSA1/START domain